MKFTFPVKEPYQITQYFGENPQDYLPRYQGHPGIDIIAPYGTLIYPPCESIVVEAREEPINGLIVRLLSEEKFGAFHYEFDFGHCSKLLVKKGQYMNTFVPIAEMGNTGEVRAGGRLVTDSERNIPPYPGTHAHFGWIKRIEASSGWELTDWGLGLPTSAIYNFDNGYQGRENPMPLFADIIAYSWKAQLIFAVLSAYLAVLGKPALTEEIKRKINDALSAK